MLGDEDDWPVRCPSCGAVTSKKIGWLKANTSLTCTGCTATLSYYRERMNRDLDDALRAVESFSRGLRVEQPARR
jgi:DNA-directed RNA polymerase subunit N (RpoN/RPB10)